MYVCTESRNWPSGREAGRGHGSCIECIYIYTNILFCIYRWRREREEERERRRGEERRGEERRGEESESESESEVWIWYCKYTLHNTPSRKYLHEAGVKAEVE